MSCLNFALVYPRTPWLRKGSCVLVLLIAQGPEACRQLVNKIALTLSDWGGGKDTFTHVTELRLWILVNQGLFILSTLVQQGTTERHRNVHIKKSENTENTLLRKAHLTNSRQVTLSWANRLSWKNNNPCLVLSVKTSENSDLFLKCQQTDTIVHELLKSPTTKSALPFFPFLLVITIRNLMAEVPPPNMTILTERFLRR